MKFIALLGSFLLNQKRQRAPTPTDHDRSYREPFEDSQKRRGSKPYLLHETKNMVYPRRGLQPSQILNINEDADPASNLLSPCRPKHSRSTTLGFCLTMNTTIRNPKKNSNEVAIILLTAIVYSCHHCYPRCHRCPRCLHPPQQPKTLAPRCCSTSSRWVIVFYQAIK